MTATEFNTTSYTLSMIQLLRDLNVYNDLCAFEVKHYADRQQEVIANFGIPEVLFL